MFLVLFAPIIRSLVLEDFFCLFGLNKFDVCGNEPVCLGNLLKG
jgi:hypothetical protein